MEVHESFRGSNGSFHESFSGSFRESLLGRYGSFHGKQIPEASTEASAKASMEVASTKASTEVSMEVVEDAAEVTCPETFTKAFTKASTKASTKAFTEASTKVSTEVLPRKLPRKHFHGYLGFSSMEASGSFHGRSEAQRLRRQLPRKLFMKAFEAASTKSWKLHPRNSTFYFRGSC